MGEGPSRGSMRDPAPHDVLAAEEFALPASDPSIRRAPVVLPDDPSGIAEPHDVLAAEEFALPACPPHPVGPLVGSTRRGSRRGPVLLGVLGLVIVGRVLRRRLR